MRWIERLAKYVRVADQDRSRQGITFDYNGATEVKEVRDLNRLILAIDDLVPPGCVLYLEGSRQAQHIVAFLSRHEISNPSGIRSQTVWPRKTVFHMAIEGKNLQELAQLADTVVGPELSEHLAVYCGQKMIVFAPDVTGSSVWLHADIDDQTAERFARLARGGS